MRVSLTKAELAVLSSEIGVTIEMKLQALRYGQDDKVESNAISGEVRELVWILVKCLGGSGD